MHIDNEGYLFKYLFIHLNTWMILTIMFCPFNVTSQVPGVNSSKDFSKSFVVYPKIFHGREKRQISSTKEEGYHVGNLEINYYVDGVKYVLDLILNEEFIPKNSFIAYQNQGNHIVSNMSDMDFDLCQYKGNVRGIKESWVAVSTCNGLNGVVFNGNNTHYLQSGKENGLDAPHFLYKDEDLISNKACGYRSKYDTLKLNKSDHSNRHKRSNNIYSIKGPYKSNKKSRYVEFVFVVDNKNYKEIRNEVYSRCRDIANIMNMIYTPLNIFIALSGIVVWSEKDEIIVSKNADDVLTNFLSYRRERLIQIHPNDNAQLLTKIDFNEGVIGKALKGPMCTFESSGGVIVDHSKVVGLVAVTAAHEMGHNFGMEHDNENCECPDNKCIMSPMSSSQVPINWSSCSLNYLTLAIEQGMDYCLRNKPEFLYSSPICGNGFVEEGEQCDCGLLHSCEGNICCNPKTCKFYPNATCATGECCNHKTCQVMPIGTTCRSAEYECDLPEFCNGVSEYCPDDFHKMDTEICDKGNSFCYQGVCRTRTDQCRILWGPSGQNSNYMCYNLNKNGSRHGNCGYDLKTKRLTPCQEEDKLCGLLHCRHLNERLEFGMEAYAVMSVSYVNAGGSIVPCRTAMVDLGFDEIDVGFVPNGAKCGDKNMCLNQKCLHIDVIKRNMNFEQKCPFNCFSNGVCNSMGNCHCDSGFAPPFCNTSGFGGSIDSGSSMPNDSNILTICICLAILFFIAIIVFIIIYKCNLNNTKDWWKNPDSLAHNYSTSRSGHQWKTRNGIQYEF